VVRTPGSAWHTKEDDPGMTAERAKRTDAKSGMRVDRADPAEDKTPFYGMYKDDKGQLNAYSTARVGWFGGPKPMLDDAPSVADPRTREFVATAAAAAAPRAWEQRPPLDQFFLFAVHPDAATQAGPQLAARAYGAALESLIADWWGLPARFAPTPPRGSSRWAQTPSRCSSICSAATRR
jgi:hypothetical protein